MSMYPGHNTMLQTINQTQTLPLPHFTCHFTCHLCQIILRIYTRKYLHLKKRTNSYWTWQATPSRTMTVCNITTSHTMVTVVRPMSAGDAVIFGEAWHRRSLPTRQLNQYSTGCKNKQKNIPISFNFLQRSSLQIFPAHANLKYLAKIITERS